MCNDVDTGGFAADYVGIGLVTKLGTKIEEDKAW
jgi:hypothetical protein